MVRVIKILWAVLLASVLTSSAYAQSAPDLLAPNIFVRGIQLPQGVRYTASFIKPIENAALQNISVEITLPAEAQFTEMLVSRQVQFHVVRKNRQRQLTLIWQISRLAADQPLDSFSFTLAQPLTAELEYYMQWQTAEGEQRVENFFEVPSVVVATQAQAQATVDQPGFVTMGDTGVQVSAPAGSTLSAQVLPLNFNPPAQYGNIWWCSLLELNGLPASTTAEVIMPLRRSLAPFTALQLFQQQADSSWVELAGQGVVTADGQYVIYTHPGGIVATGGPAEIQPDALPASEILVIEESAPPPVDHQQPAENAVLPVDNVSAQDAAPPAENSNSDNTDNPPVVTDGSSNTVTLGEATAIPNSNGAAPTPAESNGLVIVRPTLPLPAVTPISIAAPSSVPTQNTVADGSSNTIIIGEATAASTITSATPINTQPAAITDGTSNTIIIGEATFTPTTSSSLVGGKSTQPSAITDGSSNTIIVGESTSTATSAPILVATVAATRSGITDGTSNTIIISETPFTPSPTSVKNGNATFSAATPIPTRISSITDGSSNTIIISEATLTATPAPILVGTVAATRRGITDGTSNTIIISEATLTPSPTSVKNGNATFSAATPINTRSIPTRVTGITDGSSNTIIVGEKTATHMPAPTVRPTATRSAVLATVAPPPPVFSPVTGVVTTQPFGTGGARVVILKSSSNTVLQCQAGQINCSLLNRRVGVGLR